MSKVIAVLISMFLASSAFAGRATIDDVIQISTEIAMLKVNLEKAQKDRTSAVVKTVVSLSVATFLGLVSRSAMAAHGSDITGPLSAIFGVTVGGVATISGTMGVYQGIQISIKTEQIQSFKEAISLKQAQLEEAKRVLSELDN